MQAGCNKLRKIAKTLIWRALRDFLISPIFSKFTLLTGKRQNFHNIVNSTFVCNHKI